MILISLVLQIVLFILNLFPGVNLDGLSNFFTSISYVTNIFAWARVFLPVDLIIFLLGLTASAYTLQFVLILARYLISLFGGSSTK